MGLDDKTINDDEDAVMELRMMHKVHRLATYELTEPPLDAYEAFEIATLNGARVCGFDGVAGALLPGMKADAVLVDLARVENEPWPDPRSDIVEAFVQRAMAATSKPLVVAAPRMQEREMKLRRALCYGRCANSLEGLSMTAQKRGHAGADQADRRVGTRLARAHVSEPFDLETACLEFFLGNQ